MANQEGQAGSKFVVDLGDIKLPEIVEKRVEAEIQAIVLRALADVDLMGDQHFEGLSIRRPSEETQEFTPQSLFGALSNAGFGSSMTLGLIAKPIDLNLSL